MCALCTRVPPSVIVSLFVFTVYIICRLRVCTFPHTADVQAITSHYIACPARENNAISSPTQSHNYPSVRVNINQRVIERSGLRIMCAIECILAYMYIMLYLWHDCDQCDAYTI